MVRATLIPVTTPVTQLPELKKPVALPEKLRGCTAFLLTRVGYAMKLSAIEEFERQGYGLYQYSVLEILDEGDRETQATIADAIGLDRSQLVGVLDGLEERGLIERRRDPNDRRRHTVRLTDEGRRQLVEMRELVRRIEDSFLAPLDAQARESLRQALLLVASNYDLRFSGAPGVDTSSH
jgi:DNA-binding MarR family transcriptional regulator